MLVRCTSQPSASATRMPYSTAVWLTTGSVPGMPEHTGQTVVFGAAVVLSTTGQPQNILELVRSSAWTSRPMTGSYSIVIREWRIVIGREDCTALRDAHP